VTHGERWAHDLLAGLHSARYRPRAWIRFLAASFERARERRLLHRRAHRQTLALETAGLAAWAAVGASGRPVLGAAGAAWWLGVTVMLDWHLGMLERPDGSPTRGLGPANTLTLARLAVVPLLPLLTPPALAVALLAVGGLDVLDGRIAGARDEVTRLGFWLDGVADGALLGTAAVVAARAGLLPWWATGLVVARYVVPWISIATIYFAAKPPAHRRRQATLLPGFVLFAGLVLAMLAAPAATVLVVVGSIGTVAALATSAWLEESSQWRPLRSE
jgi:CDP-diacylglycerol--glycerol-3-phosphate 3-phosphatidyltransferase